MKNLPYLASPPLKRRPGRPPKPLAAPPAASIGPNGVLPLPALVPKVGWRVSEWCNAISCATSSFYNFLDRDPDLIKTVKVGRMTIILTPPEQYLADKYARQQAQGSLARPPAVPGSTAPALSCTCLQCIEHHRLTVRRLPGG
jgi:hypothetical protein